MIKSKNKFIVIFLIYLVISLPLYLTEVQGEGPCRTHCAADGQATFYNPEGLCTLTSPDGNCVGGVGGGSCTVKDNCGARGCVCGAPKEGGEIGCICSSAENSGIEICGDGLDNNQEGKIDEGCEPNIKDPCDDPVVKSILYELEDYLDPKELEILKHLDPLKFYDFAIDEYQEAVKQGKALQMEYETFGQYEKLPYFGAYFPPEKRTLLGKILNKMPFLEIPVAPPQIKIVESYYQNVPAHQEIGTELLEQLFSLGISEQTTTIAPYPIERGSLMTGTLFHEMLHWYFGASEFLANLLTLEFEGQLGIFWDYENFCDWLKKRYSDYAKNEYLPKGIDPKTFFKHREAYGEFDINLWKDYNYDLKSPVFDDYFTNFDPFIYPGPFILSKGPSVIVDFDMILQNYP